MPDAPHELPHDAISLAGQALIYIGAPIVAVLTARRQNKVDGKLDALNKTINGDPETKTPAAVDRVLTQIERVEQDRDDIRADMRALREAMRELQEGQRELAKAQREVVVQIHGELACHSEQMQALAERTIAIVRERRKSKRL